MAKRSKLPKNQSALTNLKKEIKQKAYHKGGRRNGRRYGFKVVITF